MCKFLSCFALTGETPKSSDSGRTWSKFRLWSDRVPGSRSSAGKQDMLRSMRFTMTKIQMDSWSSLKPRLFGLSYSWQEEELFQKQLNWDPTTVHSRAQSALDWVESANEYWLWVLSKNLVRKCSAFRPPVYAFSKFKEILECLNGNFCQKFERKVVK